MLARASDDPLRSPLGSTIRIAVFERRSGGERAPQLVATLLRRQPFSAHNHVPFLDAYKHEQPRSRPGVGGEPAVYLGFALGLDDQQYASVPLFALCERPGKAEEALIRERVHELGVLVQRWLVENAAGGPGGARFTRDREKAHARARR